MGKFILKRVLSAIPTLFLTLTLVFFLIRAIPGDPLYAMVGADQVDQNTYEAMAERYGLNGSDFEQYVRYLGNVVTGDWGYSFFMGKPVFECILDRIEPTLMLSLMSLIVSVVIGIPLGVIGATHENRLTDYVTSSVSVVFLCIPNFILALSLIYVFGYLLEWFPISNYYQIERYGFGQALLSMVLPALSVGLPNAANVARFTRTSMISVLKRDYIRTAQAKGLTLGRVRYVHALKNSLGTVITILSGALVGTLGGSIIVETCFSIHGIGEMVNKGLSQRDYPLAQAALLVMTMLLIVVNILLDIGYKLLDPRVELN